MFYGYKSPFFLLTIYPDQQKKALVMQPTLSFFLFPVYFQTEESSENFFCCLNTLLITIYKFQLVQNKKSVFLLMPRKLTLYMLPEPVLQQPLVNQVLGHAHQQILIVVLAVCTPTSCKGLQSAFKSVRQQFSLDRCGLRIQEKSEMPWVYYSQFYYSIFTFGYIFQVNSGSIIRII